MSFSGKLIPSLTNEKNAMSEKLKRLLGGLTIGLLLIFALVGIKSMLSDDNLVTPPPADEWQSPNAAILGLPGQGGIPSSSQQDTTAPPDSTKVELVNEPEPTPEVTRTQPPAATAAPAAVPPVATRPADLEPPVTAPVAPPVVETPAPKSTDGKLEITLQTAENGAPLPADVYVQLPNGTNISKASSTPNAKFTLKPGTYRVTARAEGRASVSRTISVAGNAAVNEIFALPLGAAKPIAPPPEPIGMPPVDITPMPIQPTPQAQGVGKLRLVALEADSGSPLPVNFTITRLDGSVVERIKNVPVAELTLPAEEFVVRFDFQGREGYKSLTVQPQQTNTHTFNIQLAPANAAPQPDPAMPALPELPPPAMGMDELLKRMQ
jgi:hypothetical protein